MSTSGAERFRRSWVGGVPPAWPLSPLPGDGVAVAGVVGLRLERTAPGCGGAPPLAEASCGAGSKALLGPLRGKAKDVLFLGWFGPIGAAALYSAAFSYRETGLEEAWVVGSLVICASLLVHGLSATPLTKLYERLS